MHDMDDSDTEEEAAIDVEADEEEEELCVTQAPLAHGNRDSASGGSSGTGGSVVMRKATPFELLAKSVNCLEMHSSGSGKELSINSAGGAANDNGVERSTTVHKVY
uniref:Sulfhydryl oxidase 2 n=1 Tax=Zeugodacus cucurbitae TaxID=28588 RepID=A0A0A1XF78_ZEUCU